MFALHLLVEEQKQPGIGGTLVSPPQFLLFMDLSRDGRGVHLQKLISGSNWSKREADIHINTLEMMVILLTLSPPMII